MKKVIFFNFLLFLLAASCSTVKQPTHNYIKINDPSRVENFTNDQLKNFIKKTPNPSVIVRGGTAATQISASHVSDRIYSILEMSLAKNGLDVRDRTLFENVIKSSSGDLTYESLYEKTHVDLLLEVSSYSVSDYYIVEGYYNQANQYMPFPPVNRGTKKYPDVIYPKYRFRGMSITIKVILLKDNLIGGSYSYSYVPCSAESGGALITNMYPLRYRPNNSYVDIDAILSGDAIGNNPISALRALNSKVTTTEETLNAEMESFITNVVVKQMIDDMSGGALYKQRNESMQEIAFGYDSRQQQDLDTKHSEMGNNDYNGNEDSSSEQVDVSFSDTDWKNSRNMTMNLVNRLIEEKFQKETSKLKPGSKKKQGMVSEFNLRTKTDLGKFMYLKEDMKIFPMLNDFVRSSSVNVSTLPKVENNYIVFYIKPQGEKNTLLLSDVPLVNIRIDETYYLFIDDSLYGTGNSVDGFRVIIPDNEFSNEFHEMKIYSSAGNNLPMKVFSTLIHFDARKVFIFTKMKKGLVLQ